MAAGVVVVDVGNNKPLKWSTIMTELKLSLALVGWLLLFIDWKLQQSAKKKTAVRCSFAVCREIKRVSLYTVSHPNDSSRSLPGAAASTPNQINSDLLRRSRFDWM